MKIRLISDLHIDINRDFGVSLVENEENDVYTLVAGDICGNVDDTIEWLRRNVRRGAFCAGNHIVYSPTKRKVPIEDIKERLHREFPPDGDVTFFDSDVGVMCKEICDGVVLISDVMYTDYMLKIPRANPSGDVEVNMRLAEPGCGNHPYLNDFVYGYTRSKMYEKERWDDGRSSFGTPKGVWHLRPKYYRDHHIAAWEKVCSLVEENRGRDVILMTHHCLSKRCISEDYVDDVLNASYVSDKDAWIRKHPNVRLILSGHVHHRDTFMVGKTRYVLNPLGYCRDTAKQFDPKTGRMVMWTPDCFVDTDTWKLTYEPYANDAWERRLDSARKYLDRLKNFI